VTAEPTEPGLLRGSWLWTGWIACLLFLSACSLNAGGLTLTSQPDAQVQQTANGTAPTAQPASAPSRTIMPDSGWSTLREGLERRVINFLADDGQLLESLYVLRLEPSLFRFDVGYRPGQPLSLYEWQQQSGALVVVNGGFFTEASVATGLVISGGEVHGSSYRGFGGMLAIDESGPMLRFLPESPYESSERLVAGLQAFPMLIRPGGRLGELEDNGARARRTVIAQDNAGRMLFIVASQGALTLTELRDYLVTTDLGLEAVLNLDGGASTGIFLAEPAEGIVSFSLLPSVVLAYPR
jgi:hypothetical protein